MRDALLAFALAVLFLGPFVGLFVWMVWTDGKPL